MSREAARTQEAPPPVLLRSSDLGDYVPRCLENGPTHLGAFASRGQAPPGTDGRESAPVRCEASGKVDPCPGMALTIWTRR